MGKEFKGKRHFICKVCGKACTDEWGGFSRYDKKFDIQMEYENLDLCPKDFKRQKKILTQVGKVEELYKKGILNDSNLKQFQTDYAFRIKLINDNYRAKKGDLKKRNALILKKLLDKKGK